MKLLIPILFMIFSHNSYSQNPDSETLSPCKDKPSCIVSLKNLGKERNFLEPIEIKSNKESAHAKIMKILKDTKGVAIIKSGPNYIHATFTSGLFKFVDDVEFSFTTKGLIHFRSNSRKGYYDFGANKERMESIRFKFHQS